MCDVANYNVHRGIYSPLVEHNGIICGFWLCGQDYRNKSPLFGAYPPSYLKRMRMLFPDRPDYWVCHLFSGMVEHGTWKEEWYLDSNSAFNPSICHDAETFYTDQQWIFDLILADPPYNNNHRKYGTKKVNKRKVIRECAMSLRKDGHLVWLDTIIPIWAKADGWELRGTIGLIQSTNHVCRVATIFKKVM